MNPKITIAVDAKNKAVASITGMLTVGSKVDAEITELGIVIPDWPATASFSGKSLRLRIVDVNGDDLARFPIASGDTWTVDTSTTPNTYKTNNGTATSPVFDMDTDKLRRVFCGMPYDGEMELGIIIDSSVDNAQYAIGKVNVRQWSNDSTENPTILPDWVATLDGVITEVNTAKDAAVAAKNAAETARDNYPTIDPTNKHWKAWSTQQSAIVDTGVVAEGQKGDNGTAATIAVGTVTTGAAGSQATVVNSGTSSAAVFDFTIPKGDTGASGTDANAVHYTSESKTDEQKAQARTNIGAVAAESGKRLMTNDEGTKLAGIATGATAVSVSSTGEATGDEVQYITINGNTKKIAGGGGGTGNYNELTNKPQIGGVTLQENKTLAEIGAVAANDCKTAFPEYVTGEYMAGNVVKVTIANPPSVTLYRCVTNIVRQSEESDAHLRERTMPGTSYWEVTTVENVVGKMVTKLTSIDALSSDPDDDHVVAALCKLYKLCGGAIV